MTYGESKIIMSQNVVVEKKQIPFDESLDYNFDEGKSMEVIELQVNRKLARRYLRLEDSKGKVFEISIGQLRWIFDNAKEIEDEHIETDEQKKVI